MVIAYERLTDALREHGSHVKENGHGKAMAQCPVPGHDDTTPSLSITAIEGRVLLYCHVCGPTATPDIVAELGLTMADLFDNRKGRDYRYPRRLTVNRYYPRGSTKKLFTQNGNKADRSLYGSQHIKGDTKVIFVVEGEQDVDAARSIGVVAVSSAMGACKAHLADWSPCHGYPILVIADKDEPGRKHAAQVAAILHGHVPTLRIFEAADGCKDLSDHIAAGHPIDELVPIEGDHAARQPDDRGPSEPRRPDDDTRQDRQPPHTPPPALPVSLHDALAVFGRWLHLDDTAPVLATAATVVANLAEGDPVWLLLVGPPSGGETEILSSLIGLA